MFDVLLYNYAVEVIIDGIINIGLNTDIKINNINIITKYILVLDTKLSNTFLLLFSDIVSPFIPL